MNSCFLPVCLAVFSAGFCFCQSRPACLEFEVTSVKPSPPLDTSKAVSFGRQIDGAQVRFTQTSLRELIRIAWAVRDYQIEAPSWLASARFNISAKLPEACTQKQVSADAPGPARLTGSPSKSIAAPGTCRSTPSSCAAAG